MTLSDKVKALTKRIEELESRIRTLETRPIPHEFHFHLPPGIQYQPIPMYTPVPGTVVPNYPKTIEVWC